VTTIKEKKSAVGGLFGLNEVAAACVAHGWTFATAD
jgi:hypothetical protein